jgi:hypothetical protein
MDVDRAGKRRDRTSYRLLARALTIGAAFSLAAGAISWFGFAGIYVRTSTALASIVGNCWPILALLTISGVAASAFARTIRHPKLAIASMAWLGKNYWVGVAALAAIVVLALGIGVAALRAFPNSGDEYGYLFQAQTFLAGRLWNPPPPVNDVFGSYRLIVKGGKWLSQYPPGWPTIIAGVMSLGLPPYVASPATAFLLLLVFARLSRHIAGPGASLVGTALLACCPFFLLNGASYFSNLPAALFGVLFVLCGLRFLETASVLTALSAGAALGILADIRPFSAVLIAIPCAVKLLREAGTTHYRRLPYVLLGILPFLALFLLYDYAITGNPLLQPISWSFPELHIGLHPVSEGGVHFNLVHTSLKAVIQLMELAQWTSPVLCVLYAAAIIWKVTKLKLAFYDFIFPMFVLGFLLFWDAGGDRYGPRYYFEAYPFMVLTVISAASLWLSSQTRNGFQQAVAVGAFASALIIAAVGYPALAYQFHRTVNARMELYDLVAQKGLSNAIVIIAAPTGRVLLMDAKDLTRNGTNFSASVLYALELPTQYCALSRAFPGRAIYRFERERNVGPGTLRLLRLGC